MQTRRRISFVQYVSWCGLFLMLSCASSMSLHAQRVDFTYETYGLENDIDNVIQNAGHLDDFFESLYQLRLTNDRIINIVHIGDSHIQADYFTSIVRRHFHRHFGNAGRGLVVPLGVARTNEPTNFKTTSDGDWTSKRIVFPDHPLPVGIGGVTIATNQPDANFQINMNDLWLDYTFNSLTLFFQKDANSFDFSIRDKSGKELGVIRSSYQKSNLNHTRLDWNEKIDAVAIQPLQSDPEQSRAIIYGAILSNSQNGVLYHTIGVNGAKYSHYNSAKHFVEQTTELHPDIFIVSLGTNESIDYPYLDKNFSSHIDKLISSLRASNPMAKFVLVTPQEVFRAKTKRNPGILPIRQQIIQYAVDNGLAFYDMYRALGGENSAKVWRESALLSTDGIHLTKSGYEYQGHLFYHALMKGYNLYVPTRHP